MFSVQGHALGFKRDERCATHNSHGGHTRWRADGGDHAQRSNGAGACRLLEVAGRRPGAQLRHVRDDRWLGAVMVLTNWMNAAQILMPLVPTWPRRTVSQRCPPWVTRARA